MTIIGIMRVSVCLGAILIPEYLDFHSGYSTPMQEQNSRNIFRNIFFFRNIPKDRALNLRIAKLYSPSLEVVAWVEDAQLIFLIFHTFGL